MMDTGNQSYFDNPCHGSPLKSPARICSCDRQGSATNKYQSQKERIFSLDPSLEDYDYSSFEKEIMEYKEQNNYNLKNIVAKRPLEFEKINAEEFYGTRLETICQIDMSDKVNILKAAPEFDKNNNTFPSKSDICLDTNKCQNQLITHISDNEFSDYEQLDGDHEDDIRFWIDELSRLFKMDIESVENSNEDANEKLREYHEVCSMWIRCIYEHNKLLIDALDEIKEAALQDTKEFNESVLSLKQKLMECHSERSYWKAKAEGLEYETQGNHDLIKKLTIDLSQLKTNTLDKDANSKRMQKDLEALQLLIIRLRDGGVWDLDGLDMSTETFTKILGADWKHLYGMKLEGFDDLKKEKMELKEELASMRHEREHLRAKLFSKERNLHKLRGEEESVKARLAFVKAEEGGLRNRVDDLKSEVRALRQTEGRNDTEDEFVKL